MYRVFLGPSPRRGGAATIRDVKHVALVGSQLPEKGTGVSGVLGERAAASLHTGRGKSLNLKEWACEDSLAMVETDEGGVLLAVADAHWGGSSSVGYTEPLAQAWAGVSGPTVATRLYRCLLKLEAAYAAIRAPEDRSETTLVLAHLEGGNLHWVSAGDSLLLRLPPGGGCELLNTLTPFFLGNVSLAESPAGIAWTQGKAKLAAGDLLLLASDGLEENVSGLDLAGVEGLIRREGSLAERVETLMERATDPEQGGGRDNLAVVLCAVS